MGALEVPGSRFELGAIFVTDAAVERAKQLGIDIGPLLVRHALGDFGEVRDRADLRQNENAIRRDFRGLARVLSIYRVKSESFYVVTEHDREHGRVTTALLGVEY